MSSKAVAWAIEQDGLTPNEKLILILMADTCSDCGQSYPSNSTLCRNAGISKEETISGLRQSLVDKGLIAPTKRRVGITGRVVVYQFPLQACKSEPEGELLACFSNPPAIPPLNGRLSNQSPGNTPVNPPAIPPLNGSVHNIGTNERMNVLTGSGKFTFSIPDFKSRIGALMKRPLNATWPYLEEHTAAELCRRPNVASEIALIEKYRLKCSKAEKDYFPKSVQSLLEGWDKCLDHARNGSDKPQIYKPDF